MTNYMAYLEGNLPWTSLSRKELKLRVAKHNGDSKKIVDALTQLLGVEEVTTRILHLKGEEIFGNIKQKLDLPPGSDGDSHRHDKVNSS
jgi:hypothetical protein